MATFVFAVWSSRYSVHHRNKSWRSRREGGWTGVQGAKGSAQELLRGVLFFCCDKVYQVHVLVREMRHVEDVEEELPGDATICPRQTIASTRQETTASPNY